MKSKKGMSAAACTYTVLPQPEPEGGYTVTCPALPGLVTYGETRDEVRAMASDAVRGYIECLREDGESIPESDPARALLVNRVSVGPATENSVNNDLREWSRRSTRELQASMRHFCPLASTSSGDGPISWINQSSRFLALLSCKFFRTTHCFTTEIEGVFIRADQ